MSDVFYANCSSLYVFIGSKFSVLVLRNIELCVSISTLTCSTFRTVFYNQLEFILSVDKPASFLRVIPRFDMSSARQNLETESSYIHSIINIFYLINCCWEWEIHSEEDFNVLTVNRQFLYCFIIILWKSSDNFCGVTYKSLSSNMP